MGVPLEADDAAMRIADRYRGRLPLSELAGLPVYPEVAGDHDLQPALDEAHAAGLDVALVLGDLDRFGTEVNGAFGHRVGDRVLVAVAAALDVLRRPQDVLLRGEGDGFKVVMFGADLTAATSWAAMARRGLTHVEVPPMTTPATASFGIAAAVAGEPATSLYHRAAEAMHRAKALGRDRIEVDRSS